MSLAKEVETYRRELPNLLDKAGKHALIHGDQVVSLWETYEDAIQEGYNLFGLQPFMVKQIQAVEFAQRFTRDMHPVCPS